MTAPHHSGTYQADRNRVVFAAETNTLAICWRCGHTIERHRPHHDGKPATWTGGHTVAGAQHWRVWLAVERVPPPGSWLAPEASTCNYSAGARRTNSHRTNPRSRDWTA